MLDAAILRKELESVKQTLSARGSKFAIDQYLALEDKRRVLQVQTEQLQAKKNDIAKQIGKKKSQGEGETALLYQDAARVKKALEQSEETLRIIKRELLALLSTLPNLLDESVPFGKSEQDNIEIMRWGEPFSYNFNIADHVTLGEQLGGIDFGSAANLAGSRFVVLKGAIARMHRALTQFMLNLHTDIHGYEECVVPYLVNEKALYGTGQLPNFKADLFHIQAEEDKAVRYSLIPTAEVPLTNLVQNAILTEKQLPLKFVAHTPCFRSEAGAYGRDTRGLIRMHQFDKIELVQITSPETSMAALETLTQHAETVLQKLQLPYRKMLLCSGDIGFSACKTYDLEVWLPSQQCYREISSCSNMGDFQARRMQARYRHSGENKISFMHTLNGSGLAVGRTLVAIMENYQQSDGTIKVPDILMPYMSGLRYVKKAI